MIDPQVIEEIAALDSAGGIIEELIADAVRRENWKAFEKLRNVFRILKNTRTELVESMLKRPATPFHTN